MKTRTLAAGASAYAYATPANSDIGGKSMAMDFYAWTTPNVLPAYMRCRIVNNYAVSSANTAQQLCVKPIGLNGTLLNDGCCASYGQSCSTPTMSLTSNEEFVCVVSTYYGAPVTGGYYRIAVDRLASSASIASSDVATTQSGAVTSGQ